MERPSPFEITGKLPDWAIKEHIKKGLIGIDPLPDNWEEKVDPVSIDLHLGNTLKIFTPDGSNTIDTRYSDREDIERMMQVIKLKEGQPFVLSQGEFVIATTLETLILPDNIVGTLEGKSSRARLGILVHSTAARFDPGWNGKPVLEFGSLLPDKRILLYYGDPICAFSFDRLAYPVEKPYGGINAGQYGGDMPQGFKPK